VLPKGVTAASAPEPLDARVRLHEVAPAQVAVIRYSGFWSQSNYDDHLARLQAALGAAGLAWTGEPVYARYNAPFTPWFMRRNEIWLHWRQSADSVRPRIRDALASDSHVARLFPQHVEHDGNHGMRILELKTDRLLRRSTELHRTLFQRPANFTQPGSSRSAGSIRGPRCSAPGGEGVDLPDQKGGAVPHHEA